MKACFCQLGWRPDFARRSILQNLKISANVIPAVTKRRAGTTGCFIFKLTHFQIFKLRTFVRMILIDDTIISDDLVQTKFCCNLIACKGACCIEGDAGAPLDDEEISILEDYIDLIKPYMVEEGVEVIEKNGVFDYDADGNFVTPLINDRECAFVYFKNNITYCAIEKAWLEKKIDFRKPISCHLYPVRLSEINNMTAVNYHEWSVCKPARKKGNELGLPLYKFLKDPLIRKFGETWFQKLDKEVKQKAKK